MAKSKVKRENYRKLYKDYFGIDFDKNYDIHHIDFNRDNNDISNLILLPKDLHAKYHTLINSLGGIDKNGCISINIYINIHCSNYGEQFLKQLGETMEEINRWTLYRSQLEMQRFHKVGINNGSI